MNIEDALETIREHYDEVPEHFANLTPDLDEFHRSLLHIYFPIYEDLVIAAQERNIDVPIYRGTKQEILGEGHQHRWWTFESGVAKKYAKYHNNPVILVGGLLDISSIPLALTAEGIYIQTETSYQGRRQITLSKEEF